MLRASFVKQYEAVKKQHADALLLVRDGQEYIAIDTDAVEVSKAEGKRYLLSYRKSEDGSIDTRRRLPVRYIHYTALDACIKKCVDAGHRVAVSEQL